MTIAPQPPDLPSQHLAHSITPEVFTSLQQHRVTVLSVPVGFGKTMLMAACMRQLNNVRYLVS